MNFKISLLIISGVVMFSCSSVKKSLRQEYTVVSYNVENLFDTVDDPKIPDEEFLPDSEKKWDSEKYQKKLADLAQVISEVNPNEMPEVVGLVEVENRTVIEDLVKTGKLNGQDYTVIHEESPEMHLKKSVTKCYLWFFPTTRNLKPATFCM